MLANHPNVLGGGGVATNIIGGTGLFADGTVAAPSISFLADQDTGIYRIGANNIGVAAGGAKVLDIAPGILTIASTGADSYISAIPISGNVATFGCDATGQYTYAGAGLGIRFRTNGGTTALTLSSAQAATFAGAVVAPSLTAPAATALALAAGSGNQNITLTPSGTGYVGHIVTPANTSQGTAGGYSGVGFAINYGGYGLAFGSNYSGQGWIQQQSFTGGAYYNLTLQASGGKLLVGTTADSSNGILQLSTNALATTSAYGIGFGTDVSLYRAAADVLALASGDALQLGNAYVGTVAVSTGTVTIRDSTGTVYRLLCVV